MEDINLELSYDILDLSQIDSDDETWLYKCPTDNGDPINLNEWLYQAPKPTPQLNNTTDEIMVLLDNFHITTPTKDNKVDSRTFTRPKKKTRPTIEQVYGDETPAGVDKPLNFDLTKDCTTSYFDNIATSVSNSESFQNASPPTLINSICSSTFSNLMESSYIKNDPVLREIRDTDYTETVLMQESQPIFQSLTTSCSSLNSDAAPEDFLKRCNNELNNSFRRSLENATILLENNQEFNGTYRKNRFVKNKSDISDNNTRTLVQDATITSNCTQNKTIENVLNSETHIEKRVDGTFLKKQNSTGSVDNLDDNMSLSSSNSSNKEPNNVLNNLEGINAIVAMQEKSLWMTSTPNLNRVNHQLPSTLSPVIPFPKSDYDLSSSDDYKSAESAPPVNQNGTLTKPKSLSNLYTRKSNNDEIKLRGSQPSLKVLDRYYRQLAHPREILKSNSNLNTMRSNLKGSYTSLRPICANLPVAPPLEPNPNETQEKNVPPPNKQPLLRSNTATNNGTSNMKPQMRSCLPRPIQTGIPRPISKIPAPKPVVSKPASQAIRKTYG